MASDGGEDADLLSLALSRKRRRGLVPESGVPTEPPLADDNDSVADSLALVAVVPKHDKARCVALEMPFAAVVGNSELAVPTPPEPTSKRKRRTGPRLMPPPAQRTYL